MNLNQVTLPSLDVERAIAFYEKMGLKLIVRSLPNYARFLCSTGESTFSVHKVDELPEGKGFSVYFECDDLDDRVEKLKKDGIVFDLNPKDQPWLWREAHMQDLDGNHLILYSAGENRLHPPWRID